MTTMHSTVIICPNCQNEMYSFELTSYYVHSSIVYSDGETICNPPIMFNELILICSECNKPFWKDDAVQEDGNISKPDPGLPEAKDIIDLIPPFDSDRNFKLAQYYSGLLENGFANTIDREIYLRIELWHTLNNYDRNRQEGNTADLIKEKIISLFGKAISGQKGIHKSDKASSLFKSNLKKLIIIYKPENDNEHLLLAEMHRELGEYNKALSVLSEIKCYDNKNVYKKIVKAAKRKRSKVFRVN